MADFEYPITAAAAPNSFAIASGLVGIADDGLVPVSVTLATDITILSATEKTTAALATAMLAWLAARGYAQTGAAGGAVVQSTISGASAPALTAVAAAD